MACDGEAVCYERIHRLGRWREGLVELESLVYLSPFAEQIFVTPRDLH